MQLTRNEVESFTTDAGDIFFLNGMVYSSNKGSVLELPPSVRDKLTCLADFLVGVGYSIIRRSGKMHVVRNLDGVLLGNPKRLPLEVAVSLYNRGNWTSIEGYAHLLETMRSSRGKAYCVRATPHNLAIVYSSKRRETIQLQRCRKTEGGLK